jgi:transposase InsO family protein
MSQAISPSVNRVYGLTRVLRAWEIPRSTYYWVRQKQIIPAQPPRRRGPKPSWSDKEIAAMIKQDIKESPFHGEGYRKFHARLRFSGVRISAPRVLRIMREHGLLSPHKAPKGEPKVHAGTIIPDGLNILWGTDMTQTVTVQEGRACIFAVIDHYNWECLGIHAAPRGTRFEALEPLRQAVRQACGSYQKDVAEGITLRHDNGSQYLSKDFQKEVKFLCMESSPSFVREPEGNGCVERFFRHLKEQLLWVRHFQTIEELRQALQDFKERHNQKWLVGRLGYRTPSQVRCESQQTAAQAA